MSEVLKSPMVTEHWVEVWIYRDGDKSGKYFRENIYPSDHYIDTKKNFRIDLFAKDGQLVCEVDYFNSSKWRKPKFWLLTDIGEVETLRLPFAMEEGGKFKFKRCVYSVHFKSVTKRLGVYVTWTHEDADTESVDCSSGRIWLQYPSGTFVTVSEPNGRVLRAFARAQSQSGEVIVPGMMISEFNPEARIISIEGNRVVVGFDPADWPKEE